MNWDINGEFKNKYKQKRIFNFTIVKNVKKSKYCKNVFLQSAELCLNNHEIFNNWRCWIYRK